MRDWSIMDERLKQLAEEGLSGSKVAAKLAEEFDDPTLTRSAVIAHGHKFGLVLKGRHAGGKGNTVWTAERIALLKAKADEGWTAARVATELGLSKNSVTGRASEEGIHFGQGKPKPKPSKPRLNRPSASLRFNPPQKFVAVRPPSLPKPIEPPTEHKPRNIGFARLSDKTCRWPLDDAPPFHFCGNQVDVDGPYCSWHDSVAHGRPGQTRQEAKHR